MHQPLSQNGLPAELREGGYYSIVDGERFVIAKVLKLEPDKVHIRIYKQHFFMRPVEIDLSLLTLSAGHDPEGCGIGHLPLRRDSFQRWEPVLITESAVTTKELEGYELWKEAGGAVWE